MTTVTFRSDGHTHTVSVRGDDLLIVEVDGRPVVGVSLATGAVGVWDRTRPDDDDWVQVWHDDAIASNGTAG